MRTLAPPDPKLWQSRADWFWRAHDANAGPHALDLSPRANLLLAELEAVFCSGAWAATVIVAWALVEAEERVAARAAAARREEPRPEPDADWLRERWRKAPCASLSGRCSRRGGDERGCRRAALHLRPRAGRVVPRLDD
jgi:hypothetical protein